LRKTIAILLLAIMVFNLMGYRLLFNCLENQAQAQMAEQLDHNHYSRTSLTEVKVALHLPYTINNKNFERYDGSVELNGITYNYLERKVQNDTLILHCLPNTKSDNIKLARSEYGKAVNDIAPVQKGQKSGHASLLLKSLVPAVYKSNSSYNCSNAVFTARLIAYVTVSEKIFNDRFVKSPEQPPDAA
jgi:hypothetical protein